MDVRFLLIVVSGLAGIVLGVLAAPAGRLVELFYQEGESARLASADPAGFTFSRSDQPPRTDVTDQHGVAVGTFTDGARTVTLQGPVRTFAEPRYTNASVTTDRWVRLAPEPWRAGAEAESWVRQWLSATMVDRSPDILAIAMQYIDGAPDMTDAAGIRYSGAARFGPELDNGKREVGADFYDYLGRSWRFADGTERLPDSKHFGSLDCSGFLRMVYGYRAGYPLLSGDTGPGLPRRADSMAKYGPGALIIADSGARPAQLRVLRAGDLLFFTTDSDPDIDHSAIYLGADSNGHLRFISSRGGADGPTMGDFNGASVLDDDGFFAARFRQARRI